MKFNSFTLTPKVVRAGQLQPSDIDILKHEGGCIYSVGLCEFTAIAEPAVGDYLVYVGLGQIPEMMLQHHFIAMVMEEDV